MPGMRSWSRAAWVSLFGCLAVIRGSEAATCADVGDADCGEGHVSSGRDAATCANDPCAVLIPEAADHPLCCMVGHRPKRCSECSC